MSEVTTTSKSFTPRDFETDITITSGFSLACLLIILGTLIFICRYKYVQQRRTYDLASVSYTNCVCNDDPEAMANIRNAAMKLHQQTTPSHGVLKPTSSGIELTLLNVEHQDK